MPDDLSLPGVPFPLAWSPAPAAWRSDGAGLEATALPHSDLFASPAGEPLREEAARLLGRPPAGDFVFSALVEAPFGAAFDAGALLLWAGADRFGKLAMEYSPGGEPMVVSVVTRGLSDDANGQVLPSGAAVLRIARVGSAYAFHASLDGRRFAFVRHFALEAPTGLQLGVCVQSPTGEGCTARFSDLRFERRTLGDLRDGS